MGAHPHGTILGHDRLSRGVTGSFRGMFRFAIGCDSHIRFPGDGAVEYPSNALMTDRNRYVVDLCNRLRPEFVIHLGDVVHPLPTEEGHEPAV